ncbi:MAG TPA: three-Cys-motif partner protein TcmP [Verrucomicrobiae bacterium]|nr:three-Cys-motif partner protein TcmP [Verrucomicrobiae bacterium]
MTAKNEEMESLEHLKQVSKIKLTILQKYLPVWETILGSQPFWHGINYIDCYAGPGFYEYKGKKEQGSPLIVVQTAKEFLRKYPGKEMTVGLVENNAKQFTLLQKALKTLHPYPKNLTVDIQPGDSTDLIPNLLNVFKNLAPTFFMVDPYGHPLTIPILNQILSQKYTEALINFMFFRINMDINNPKVKDRLNKMFGDEEWQKQEFIRYRGIQREIGMLEYFKGKLQARFKLHFRIRFDVEDKIRGNRTKYYLIHASNHVKAALLMKEVMWRLGDEEGLFDYGGSAQGILFSSSPTEYELRDYLLKNFSDKKMTFDEIREETWEIPFIEKHYRAVLKKLERESPPLVKIERVFSKKDGLQKNDLVYILPHV